MAVEMLKKDRVFDDFFSIDDMSFKLSESPDEVIRRLVINRPDAVAVLLHNVEHDTIIMVKQFRAPTYKKLKEPYILEVPAGVIDKGETPEQTAIRETLEETGYTPQKLQHIHSFFSSVGISSEQIHIFYGEVTNNDKVAKGGGLESEGEYLEVIECPVKEILNLVKNNQIMDAKTIISINWFEINKLK